MAINWTLVDEGVIASTYPASEEDLAVLGLEGVTLVVNLHERDHGSKKLARFGMTELHLPVTDFTPPSQQQIETAHSAIAACVADGHVAAVHCAAGIGRTGTVVACWLVRNGMSADVAVARVRELRPGSVETPQQVAAVHEFARRLAS